MKYTLKVYVSSILTFIACIWVPESIMIALGQISLGAVVCLGWAMFYSEYDE